MSSNKSAPAMNRSIIEVMFKVRANVRFGEEVRVSGNVPALGCYSPERTIPLVTSKADYPCWSTKSALFLPGDNGLVNYRYCIFSGGKFVRWENEEVKRPLYIEPGDRDKLKTTMDYLGSFDQCEYLSSAVIPSITEKRSFKTRQLHSWSLKNQRDVNLDPASDAVVIVSYFLPVILDKSSDGKWSAIWDEENVIGLQLNIRTTWVGSVKYRGGIKPEDEEKICDVLRPLNCNPLFLNHEDHHQFYDLFCKGTLWPVLHHVADVYGPLRLDDNNPSNQENLWHTYNKVCLKFRNKVVEVYHEGDLIWIQGFHLCCLPAHLRRKVPLAKICVFFHTPFPSTEIWRTMSRREELLSGLLSADQVGFHLYEYARHFLTGCRRMLGHHYEYNPNGELTINANGREVIVTPIHVGIDLALMERILQRPSLYPAALEWKKKFPNRVIIAGIDRLERLKGIPLKLFAIEELMAENPQYRGKLAFVIIGVSAEERQTDYQQTRHDVSIIVSRINKKYSIEGDSVPVVHFEERDDRSIALEQRLAFFAAADILISSALRDGLNRMPIEFTLARARCGLMCEPKECQPTLPGGSMPNEGLVIVSEFVTSTRVMRGSLVVNPYRVDAVKNALKRALEMDSVERSDRMRRNLEFSVRLTASAWADEVLRDLKQVEKSGDIEALGLGANFRVVGVRAGFHPLDMTAMTKVFRQCTKRLILLDWGGTLVAEADKQDKLHFYALSQGHATRTGPTAELTEVLKGLCADKRNIVFVVSGKEINAVSEFFGNILQLNLGAEHGFYYSWNDDNLFGTNESVSPVQGGAPRSRRASIDDQRKWRTMSELGEAQWKEAAMVVMDVYVQRTHGTYIEQKGHALIWQYRDADPEFGYLQSKELEENLSMALAGYGGVEVLRGGGVSDGYVEVRPSGISKGLFLEHILSLLKTRNLEVDFLLTVGDDSSDEPMFEVVESLLSRGSNSSLNAYSVTVGKKPTAARAYIDDPASVLEMLGMLNKSIRSSVTPRPEDIKEALSGMSLNITKDNSRPTLYVNSSPNMTPPLNNPSFSKLLTPTVQTQVGSSSGAVSQSTSRRSGSRGSFDRLAIEIQASSSLTASRTDLWRAGGSVERCPSAEDEKEKNVPEVTEEAEGDDAIFF
eukprot:CAMPEP_0182418418 /NCGR_PEP_ID=MMETSP1167-20130531/2856_1 /TAXON_ID=2988 /ORGANISM="Mallomonas Sp, Strain CCMP3275" /LENGTH=1137 /DNA_ID=CAMNT_0024592623 /DNA_START=42 /DNA_END=3455 /DNA_ORIENTATION=+